MQALNYQSSAQGKGSTLIAQLRGYKVHDCHIAMS